MKTTNPLYSKMPEIIDLYRQGLSMAKIGKRIGATKAAVHYAISSYRAQKDFDRRVHLDQLTQEQRDLILHLCRRNVGHCNRLSYALAADIFKSRTGIEMTDCYMRRLYHRLKQVG